MSTSPLSIGIKPLGIIQCCPRVFIEQGGLFCAPILARAVWVRPVTRSLDGRQTKFVEFVA
jgi:hypothetical protein